MTLTLQDAAARCGGHCAHERHLFELLGRASRQATAPAATAALDRWSLHAAWRAAQWWDRLPVLAGVDRSTLVAAGAPGDPLPAADGDAAVLAVVARVTLPRLALRYRRHRLDAAPAADGPILRTLEQVLADVARDREEADDLLLGALGADGAVDAAAEAVRRADRLAGPLG